MVSIENTQKFNIQFNILSNLIPSDTLQTKIVDVSDQLEWAFIKHCFDETKLSNMNKVTRVQKVINTSVQMRFLNELKIVRQKNKDKPLH